ncbi:MFS transporter [Gordonia sp. NPDC058843]|uniref:MFS transporter n=1 Tax=Gordonia sp. NPDC058843 TaxID=3346648 RepID=UPI0036990286
MATDVGLSAPMATAPRPDRGIRVLAGASGVGFILAICGSNAMTPLLPGYMDTHDFGPAAASVLFATYFIALIIVLLISARGPLIRHARTVLPIAFLAAITGDLLQIAGASVELLLFPGRFLTGASVGLSTGAAAAIMVAARGERGRAFIASGSLIGAGTGLVAAIAIAVFLPWQLVTVYAIHAAATAVCLIVLLVGLRLAPDLLAPRRDSSRDAGDVAPRRQPASTAPAYTGDLDVARARRRDPGAYLVGALAWAIGALAVGAMPAAILATGASDSLLVAQCVGGACLLVSMVASFAGAGVRIVTTLPAVGVLLVIGWSTAVVGLILGRLDVIVLGTVVGGVGQAGGYRVALATITGGLIAVEQGRVASRFSAFAYSGAGVMVVLDGIAGQAVGTIGGAVVTGIVYAVVAAVAIALVVRRDRAATGGQSASTCAVGDPGRRVVGAAPWAGRTAKPQVSKAFHGQSPRPHRDL